MPAVPLRLARGTETGGVTVSAIERAERTLDAAVAEAGPERRVGGRRDLDIKARTRCPFCGAHDNKVLDVWMRTSDQAIRRRHECTCGKRFNSTQTTDPLPVA